MRSNTTLWDLCCRLSANRSAGVITFDSSAIVRIHLNEASTSDFITKLNAIPYTGGGTDILNALTAAIKEINAYKVHPLTLVCEYLSYRIPIYGWLHQFISSVEVFQSNLHLTSPCKLDTPPSHPS
jgi:hypothetical protein